MKSSLLHIIENCVVSSILKMIYNIYENRNYFSLFFYLLNVKAPSLLERQKVHRESGLELLLVLILIGKLVLLLLVFKDI